MAGTRGDNFDGTPYTQCGKIQYTVEKNGVKKPW